MKLSQALSRASKSRFIRESLLENGVRFGVRQRIIKAVPGFPKLQEFALDLRSELTGWILRIFYHTVELQTRAQKPFTIQFELRQFIRGRRPLNDFSILSLKIIIDGFH